MNTLLFLGQCRRVVEGIMALNQTQNTPRSLIRTIARFAGGVVAGAALLVGPFLYMSHASRAINVRAAELTGDDYDAQLEIAKQRVDVHLIRVRCLAAGLHFLADGFRFPWSERSRREARCSDGAQRSDGRCAS